MDPSKLKVVELRAELTKRGLETKGLKAVLVERLKQALEEEISQEEPKTSPNKENVPGPLRRSSTFTLEEVEEPKTSPSKENVPGPLRRSSTFTLEEVEEPNTPQDKENIPEPAPLKRSSTFVLEEVEEPSSQPNIPRDKENMPVPAPLKRSSTFILDEVVQEQKCRTPDLKSQKSEKSIGKRILTSSKKFSGAKPHGSNLASTSKKTGSVIKKTAATPGSVYKNKFGVAKKLPNFKAIHQRLFGNMESLGDSQNRKLQRAEALICSPVVPRCATLHQNPNVQEKTRLENSNTKKVMTTKVSTPARSSPRQLKLKTPTSVVNPASNAKSASVNRFGFKPRITLETANRLVGSKLPPVNIEKKKQEERTILKGVRMNKRFMLQMQMRQSSQMH